MNTDQRSTSSPVAIITGLITSTATQVERISSAVLAQSNLVNEMADLIQTTAALRRKLSALALDERDCQAMLADVAANRLGHMIEFQSLSEEAMNRLRRRLKVRLTTHLASVQRNIATLERGIELARAGMTNRFAAFAVAGLSQDREHTLDKGSAFIVAYLVAARLKDSLQIAGFKWTGEKTLISLYLNAIGCERRQSKERFVADPVSSIIATKLGFVSAMQLHQTLFQLHAVLLGQVEPSALEIVNFYEELPIDFERGYFKIATPEEAFQQLITRTKTAGPKINQN